MGILALGYLGLCFLVGTVLTGELLPDPVRWTSHFAKRKAGARPGFLPVYVPAAFLLGMVFLTWITYLIALATRDTGQPMLWGNVGAWALAFVFLAALWRRQTKARAQWATAGLRELKKFSPVEKAFFSLALLLSAALMFHTLRASDGSLVIGHSVRGDLGLHLSMSRSFSQGLNFPTQYSHFPDGTIRYHFLFQFLVGNLEYLGLPLQWALNLPSLLTFFFLLVLSRELTLTLTSSANAGWLAPLFLLCRSSLAFFTHLAKASGWREGIERIFQWRKFIGDTANEYFGMWSLNAFVCQRHLASAVCLLFLLAIALHVRFSGASPKRIQWKPRSPRWSLFLGLTLGLLAYWNGAVLLSALLMFGVYGLFSRQWGDFAVLLGIGALFAVVEAHFFMGRAGTSFRWHPGFLAASASFFDISRYLLQLQGVLPLLVAFGAGYWFPKLRPWALAACLPLVFAFTVQVAPDLNINHKFILVTVFFWNVVAAAVIAKAPRVWAVPLGFLMLCSGFVDFCSLVNSNQRVYAVSDTSPVLQWIREHTDSRAVFLAGEETLVAPLLAGRPIYAGVWYMPWSAGYDVSVRRMVQKQVLESNDPKVVRQAVEREPVDYVFVRNGGAAGAGLRRAFPIVFEDPTGARLYKVRGEGRALASIPGS